MPSDRNASRRSNLFTNRPESPAPPLQCPDCDGCLRYTQTVYGGVSPTERWDQYECVACGPFEYRHRTKKIKRLPTERSG
jgi:hypothetical protein